MQTIQLSKGQVAIVDDDLYDSLTRRRWHAWRNPVTGKYYARRYVRTGGGRRHLIHMHREVVGLLPGDPMRTDHIDGNTLDNRRENLRVATTSQNNANRGPQKNNTSGYKGVSRDKWRSKWRAQIQIGGRYECLGNFDTKEEAAVAYNHAARERYGEFAYQNPIVTTA
jgi:hypothetical protein